MLTLSDLNKVASLATSLIHQQYRALSQYKDRLVSYTRAWETSAGCLRSICLVHPGVPDNAGCLRSIYPSLGMRQLFGDVTMGQWRHN